MSDLLRRIQEAQVRAAEEVVVRDLEANGLVSPQAAPASTAGGVKSNSMTEDLTYRAMMFARKVHATQTRKYTGNPYVDHLAEVAGIVATVAPAVGILSVMIAAAWLHDYIEDQRDESDVTGHAAHRQLEKLFGKMVADGVLLLSDLEEGNRAERKAASRQRLAAAPAWVQTIKCADLISNTSSIVKHDPQFAVVYLEEKRLLLDVLTHADPRLRTLARAQAQGEPTA